MANKLSDKSRDILSYRPNISFVEPDQVDEEPTPIAEEATQAEEVQELRDKVKTLAKAVNTLASSIQAKADVKAKDMKIALDPVADAAVVASMKRMFGHKKINPREITYEQYKYCKERIREKGEELGQRMVITEEELESVKDAVTSSGPNAFTKLGGYDTDAAKNGGLRPELQKQAQVIEPIDMEVLQAYLVRIFMNAVWEKFIYPLFSTLPVVGELMPKQLVEIPSDGYSAEELVSLGVPVIGYPQPKQPTATVPESPDDV